MSMLRNSLQVFAGLVCAALVWAQSETGSATLNGSVFDPTGAAVAGAVVRAIHQQTGLVRETTTTATGLYALVRLPAGTYEVSVEAKGFKTARAASVPLNVGAVATLDFTLEVGAAAEQVTVTAEAPVVETTRSQTSTVVNEKAIRDLPINGRNFLDFTLLTPGVVRDPRGGDLSFGGQRGTANSLLIDGGDSNNIFFGQAIGRTGAGRNPYSFSIDAVQEFQVNLNTYGAEMGRAGAGIINVITKSGTNELHGAGFWFYRDRALNANLFTNNARGIPRQPYHYNQFGGNLGGPVVKDRLFYFFNYDGQRNTLPNPVFFPVLPRADDVLGQRAVAELSRYLVPYTRRFDNDVYTFKADWILSQSRNLSLRYNANRFTGKNLENSGSTSALEHTGDSNVNTDTLAASFTQVLGTNKVWDARFSFLRDDEPGTANGDAPEAVVREGNNTVLAIGRNNFSPRYTNSRRYQVIQTLAWTAGRHQWKLGGDLNFERIENFFPGLFSGSYTFNSFADFAARRPFSYSQAFAGPNTSGPLTRPNANEYAFFVQDAWRVTERLTLNYGLRYDLMDQADPKVRNPDPELLAQGLDTARMNLDRNNLAPRFGFAWRLPSLGNMVVRGGYGIFYGRTPAIVTGTAHSQNGIQVLTYQIFSGFPEYPNRLSAPPSGATVRPNIYVFTPDYVQPQTHQWSLNIERQLGGSSSLTVGYLGVRGIHLTRSRDINLYPAELVTGTLAGVGPVQFWRHPGVSGPARPNPRFGRITIFESGADSIYHGGFIQWQKRYSRGFQVLASYTWSHVIDTVPDATSVVVGTDDFKNAQDTLRPNLDRGNGDSDVRHKFVFSGVWDLEYGRRLTNRVLRALARDYQISLIANVLSGRYFSPTVNGDPNNNGQAANDRPMLAGRNIIEGPGFAAVDARVSRDIPLGTERLRLRLMGEAFNLTNRANFDSFNRGQYTFNAATRVFTPNPTFMTMTGTAPARILQLAARISF